MSLLKKTSSQAEEVARLLVLWRNALDRGESVDLDVLTSNNASLKAAIENTPEGQQLLQWMLFTPNLNTDTLVPTKLPSTMGAIQFSQAPVDQPIRADGYQIGDKIADRYRLIHILGEGGSAVVWLANDLVLERLVAVKIYRASFLEDQDPKTLATEARIMARFEHPCILPIYDQGEHEGRLFLILKYVPKRPGRSKTLPLRVATKVVLQMTESLKFLHDHGILHCDIKPANILIDPNGRAFLSDYGIAQDSSRGGLLEHTAGTPGFLAPERSKNGTIGAQSDIYSLGVVLFYYLVGHLPNTSEPATLAKDMHDLPTPVQRLVEKAVSHDPKRRFATMDEFSDALKKQANHKPGRFRKIAIAAAILLTGLTTASAWVARDYLSSSPKYPTQVVSLSRSGFNKVFHGDWDTDGDQDLGTFHSTTGAMEFYFNNGKGEFALFDTIYRDNTQTDINPGYFDDDERLDLLHSFGHKPVVSHSVFSKGKFLVEGKYANINLIRPIEPKTADFNRDGHNDLILLDGETNDIGVRLGEENEIFKEEITLTACEYESGKTIGLYIGDLNNDKFPDFIVGVQNTADNPSGATVFLQTSPGVFNEGTFYPIAARAELGLGELMDADQDGDKDLVLPDRVGDRLIHFVNDGKGGFIEHRTLLETPKPGMVVQLDPHNSNKLELAVSSTLKGISILGLQPAGNWKTIQSYDWIVTPRGLAAADLDNDGTFDIIANRVETNQLTLIHRKKSR